MNRRRLVSVLLCCAAVAVAEVRAVEGNLKSAVRVIAFEDLQCGDCAAYRRILDDHLLPKYGGRVAFEHRDFPLPRHNWAREAAIIARALDERHGTAGVEFRRWALASLKEMTRDNFEARVRDWAAARKLAPDTVLAYRKDPAASKLVEEDLQEGVARGVSRTPTVFVNGQPFIETFTVEEISKGIESALAAVSGK